MINRFHCSKPFVRLLLFCVGIAVAIFVPNSRAEETYPRHPDSIRRDGIAPGDVQRFTLDDSSIFPGTTREVAIYIPAAYQPSEPAAVMIFQDGLKYVRENSGWHLPEVFDNLIDEGAMPVTVAVCVMPGEVDAGDEGRERYNRSFEYDSVSPRYAKFIIEELLPQVRERVQITDDPNRTAIGGSSSGAIAAFGVAWHRPDRVRRVFSTIGTYVGLRGGDAYPTLVRKSEPKPLRVFLQDGRNDLNIYGGDWFTANLDMLSALQWGGYQTEHVWGDGGHNGKHGGAIFPDALRWLWKDANQPIEPPSVANHPEWSKWLLPGEAWRTAEEPRELTDLPGERSFAVVDDGLVRTDADGSSAAVAIPMKTVDAAVQTPDAKFLWVASNEHRHAWSFRITDDGELVAGQPLGHFHIPITTLRPGVSAATITRDGEPMFATAMGIQCMDPLGRVHLLMDPPPTESSIEQLLLSDDRLMAKCGSQWYERTVAVEGVPRGERVIPPKPGL